MAERRQDRPGRLWIVRHAESIGNLARDAADRSGAMSVERTGRDVDVPLSPLGEQQAEAVGRWFGSMGEGDRPTALYSSPYLRAQETARRILASVGLAHISPVADERLREREFGTLDGLTHAGIVARYPDEVERRASLGKFYYRPPAGESWCDVVLRLRSILETLIHDARRERVVVVCHTVVVFGFRYLLEQLTETQLLEIDRSTNVANCSITSYRFEPSRGRGLTLALEGFNFTAPLEREGSPVTVEPGRPPDA